MPCHDSIKFVSTPLQLIAPASHSMRRVQCAQFERVLVSFTAFWNTSSRIWEICLTALAQPYDTHHFLWRGGRASIDYMAQPFLAENEFAGFFLVTFRMEKFVNWMARCVWRVLAVKKWLQTIIQSFVIQQFRVVFHFIRSLFWFYKISLRSCICLRWPSSTWKLKFWFILNFFFLYLFIRFHREKHALSHNSPISQWPLVCAVPRCKRNIWSRVAVTRRTQYTIKCE